MTSSETNITAEDVKDKLFQSLKTRGVLDSLKSQLRKQLIWELQDTTGLPLLQSDRGKPSGSMTLKTVDGNAIPLFQRISNSIVAEHLKRCNYEYTLSTFLPESGTSSDKMFADKDILHLLRINPDSKMFKHLERSPGDWKGFLWKFLLEIAALHNNSRCDAENQTEETLSIRTGCLEEKLSDVEKEYSEKLRLFQLEKNQGMEEKLLTVQKNYEAQKRKELQEEIKKFKLNEMSSLKLEERGKYEAEVKKIRQEYDQEFNLKRQALRAMEKEMLERMQRQQEVQESERYAERQKMLQDMHSFKQREADLKNRIELQERSQKVDEARIQNEAGHLKDLEGALKEKENLQAQRYKEEVERFKIDYEKQFTASRQELLRQESRLQAEKLRLDSEREKYLQFQDDLTAYREKNVQLQTSVETARILLENINKQKTAMEEKLAAMKDYDALKEKEIIFKRDIEHLTQRLADTNTYWKEQGKKQQRLVKGLTDKAGKPSKEVVALRKELKDVKERFKVKEKSLDEARRKMENRLNMEIQRANHFQNLCEDQMSSQRLMETEMTNLKMMQQQTEQLLSMEMRQQKRNYSYIALSSSRDWSAKNPAVNKIDSQEGSIRKYETDESSTVDESSLVSLAEDRQNFEKLEREAEALDASYRDFQDRMRATTQVGSMPSTMSFRRLPSYHSFHSADNVAVPQNRFEFRPLALYREFSTSQNLPSEIKNKRRPKTAVPSQPSPQRLPSARMHYQAAQATLRTHDLNEMSNAKIKSRKLTADETDAFTVNDLDAVPLSSATNSKNIKEANQIKRGSSSNSARLVLVGNEKENELISIQKIVSSEEKDGHHSRNEAELNDKEQVFVDTYNSLPNKSEKLFSQNRTISTDAENYVVNKKTSNVIDSSDGQQKPENENCTDGAVRSRSRTSDKDPGHGPKMDYSEGHEFGELPGSVEETTLDRMWERRDGQGHKGHIDNRTSGSLDMDELEERRRKDTLSKVDVDYYSPSENASGESLDEIEQESGTRDESLHDDSANDDSGHEELELSAEKNDDDNNEEDKLGTEGNGQDPTIDPMMLKYMEMIKQRRENETNDVENDTDEKQKHVIPTDRDMEPSASLGKEDDDVSVGKLSDEDFNWE